MMLSHGRWLGLLALGALITGCPEDNDWPDPTVPINLTDTPTETGLVDPTPTALPTQSPSEATPSSSSSEATATQSPSATPSQAQETATPVTETPSPTASSTPETPTPTSTATPATPTPTAPVDGDGDGFVAAEDCDDGDALAYPGASETCDGVDNDCDGLVDDDDPDASGQGIWYLDLDGDGFGNEGAPTLTQCAAPAGYVSAGGDCDDTSAAYNPDAEEADCADPNDYNCDGSTGYVDQDGDGFAACEECDDEDAGRNPAAQEICDGQDNDCDGLTDDADGSVSGQSTYYADTDGDGYGDAASPILACGDAPAGAVSQVGDCDDDDAALNPETLWSLDRDGDGFGDSDITLSQCRAPERYVLASGDCDDGDVAFYPGAPEEDCADPNDYNCDGSTAYSDGDGDGFAACEECDDEDADRNPGATEICDGQDNDCDGLTDDADGDVTGQGTFYPDGDGDGAGASEGAVTACVRPEGMVAATGDCDDGDASVAPGAEESCDGDDQDCDGAVDEEASDAGTFYADGDGDGYGTSAQTLFTCEAPEGYVSQAGDCDDSEPASHVGASEVCDGEDNDCDGQSDEGVRIPWYLDRDDDGYGDSAVSTQACAAPAPAYVAQGGDCDEQDPTINPGAEEGCDGVDRDCDGAIDSDADGDGFSDAQCGGLDCDDSDVDIFPSPGGCALGGTCLEILSEGRSVGSGDYVIDPDGLGGVDAFTAYCDMDTDGGGWTVALQTGSPTEQKQWFTGGDAYRWLPVDFTYDLETDQLDALRAVSTEALQDVTFHCYHVIADYYEDGANYDYATHWAGAHGRSDLVAPNWISDACEANDSVWRFSEAVFTDVDRLPVTSVEVRDAGDAGEYFGIDYGDAYFR